jgi:single-stranded DNA-binding protein
MMHVLVSGVLVNDPARRTSQKGQPYTTANVRVANDDGSFLASVVAFNAQAEQLALHRKGSALAISGRGKLSSWTSSDGTEQHGISIVAQDIASAEQARRADAKRRQEARQ